MEHWDDDGVFDSFEVEGGGENDLERRNPFDLSKALEGAALEELHPSIKRFELISEFEPSGDQPKAIDNLISQLENGQERCVLLGVTGSGKTYTMAHIIQRLNIPTLIMSHNKTLARQLYHEMAGYFPNNAVEYFVSHYDYYQPEAYIAKRDLYIEKEMGINERIEQERFATVASLVTRPDCVVVSSVSCIYGLNPPEAFLEHHARCHIGQHIDAREVLSELIDLQYKRTPNDLARGEVRLRGEVLDVWMPSRDDPLRITFDFDVITSISVCDPVTWEVLEAVDEAWIHPKEFFMTSQDRFEKALESIEEELKQRLSTLSKQDKIVEHMRLQQRTDYDLEMLREIGHCQSIENYSRHFDGRSQGERPYCLLDFFAACAKQFHGDAEKFLVIMDESHVSLPQIGGMFLGDKSRKDSLIEHGFRLPSAADNRPLKLPEFQQLVPQMVYVSATPGERELRHLCEVTGQDVSKALLHVGSGGGANIPELQKKHPEAESMYDLLQSIQHISKMEIRPTGLLDPEIEVRPTSGQINDLLSEINLRVDIGQRTLVTVMTIKFAEEVADYLNRMGVKAHHLHSEIDTIERTEIINALRLGHIDVIVGINLLREGLDIPEVSLVAIFDAGKQGFLRNERSLLQTIGRAARNAEGKVILYSDVVSPAMAASIRQTLERRQRQQDYNKTHNIIPSTIQKALPVMGADVEDLLVGTTTAKDGSRRLISKKGGRKDGDWAQRMQVGAGSWSHSNKSIDNSNIQLENSNQDAENRSEIHSVEDLLTTLREEMKQAAVELDFERAANLRDEIYRLERENTE